MSHSHKRQAKQRIPRAPRPALTTQEVHNLNAAGRALLQGCEEARKILRQELITQQELEAIDKMLSDAIKLAGGKS